MGYGGAVLAETHAISLKRGKIRPRLFDQ